MSFRALENLRGLAGPILILKVNGQLPGAEISVKPGETVHIEASAEGWIAKPKYLEIVAQGDVIAAANPSGTDERKCVSVCDVVVTNSTWITARCSGALTSPVYVRVGNESWWKREAVPELVKTRLAQLEEIQALALRIESGYTSGYADPDRLRNQLPRLREQVAAARELYNELRRKAQSTENHSSSGNREGSGCESWDIRMTNGKNRAITIRHGLTTFRRSATTHFGVRREGRRFFTTPGHWEDAVLLQEGE